MRVPLRRPGRAALALASLATVVACSSPLTALSSGENGAPTSSQTSASQLDPQAKGPAAPIEGARRGGHLTVRSQGVPETLDPTRQYYVDSQAILKLTNRTLTTFAIRDGKPVLVPDLATDLGRVSADGLTWTFTLKEGLAYEDGTPVKAADVVYAVQRSFAQQELPGGPTYQIDHLKGGSAYRGPYQGGTSFPGVEAKGDKDVVFHLSAPWSSLPYFGTFTVTSPIPAAKDTRDKYGLHPLATGPYKFETYKDNKLTLVRNTQWKAETDPARRDLLDSFTFEWGGEPKDTQGPILDDPNASGLLSYDPVDSTLVLKATAAKGQLTAGDSPCVSLVTMDTRQIPLSVRKAIARAYPWDQVREAADINQVTVQTMRSIAPPQLPGAVAHDIADLPVSGRGDPAAARKLLEQAGKLGFELSWYFATDMPTSRAVSEARARGLRAAGFTVRPHGVPRNKLREMASNLDAPVNMLQGPSGWCYDWPSGDAIYLPLFSSTAARETMSAGGLADPDLDARMKAIAARPLADQASEWAALDKDLLTNYLPVLPGGMDRAIFLSSKDVGGVVDDPNLGMPDFSSIYLRN
ncbi:ABC transporter substrate-binding protein [Arsenicicoccus dermatophilus]|uniref:ABC transporter substrate-binding protein n=1 Tax=Arsenicicoccus dermatophilus TaxID=1076331 RepID=UPI001F4CCCBF|nr:ABC transporter substrate-binding protein [Arsenicicoccus dermatophilus]MCH8613160.1 ABC transporter substrate-binding protein [Arsenicicoccus dermatophilus]